MQPTLLPKKDLKFAPSLSHGGVTKGKRKTKRPLVPGAITHLILKSSQAKGARSFRKNEPMTKALLKERANKFFIEILDFVIMGNHLHLKVRFKDRRRFQNFLRTFMGLLSRKLTRANRGNIFGKFWDGLAFTRVLSSRLEEFELKKYFNANRVEKTFGKRAREEFLEIWKFSRKNRFC